MELFVYRLRHKGNRIPRNSIGGAAHFARKGNLTLMRATYTLYGKVVWTAQLLDEAGKDVLAPLEPARLLRVQTGLLIAGMERVFASSKDTGTDHRQSWLCVNARLPLDVFSQSDEDESIPF